MNINIRTHHVNITDAIKDYVEKKLGKLDKYFDHVQELAVDLEYSDISDQNKRHIITVTAWVSGSVMRAKEASGDMYSSVDLVFGKLEKQFVRHKEKLKRRHRQSTNREFAEMMQNALPDDKPIKEKKSRHYRPKPMYPEDAASHLESENIEFFMFRNAQSNEINVLYVDENGELDLLEP